VLLQPTQCCSSWVCALSLESCCWVIPAQFCDKYGSCTLTLVMVLIWWVDKGWVNKGWVDKGCCVGVCQLWIMHLLLEPYRMLPAILLCVVCCCSCDCCMSPDTVAVWIAWLGKSSVRSHLLERCLFAAVKADAAHTASLSLCTPCVRSPYLHLYLQHIVTRAVQAGVVVVQLATFVLAATYTSNPRVPLKL
jgi:hypothetical protein